MPMAPIVVLFSLTGTPPANNKKARKYRRDFSLPDTCSSFPEAGSWPTPLEAEVNAFW